MATNLVTDVLKMASPAILDRLATAFGVNPDVARTVLATAVPSIFAGVASQAATPGGLSNLMNVLGQANPNVADTLNAPLTGGAGSLAVAAGTNALRSVLGESSLNSIINGVTRSAGVNAAAGSSLVAIAGQMAMGALSQQTAGLDANGVRNLLSAQASNFQMGMPGSLSGAVGGVSAAASNAASSASAAARNTTAAMQNSANAAASGGTNWLMWLLPVLVVLAGLWYYLGHRTPAPVAETAQTTTTQQAAPAPAPAPAAPAAVMVDNVDVSKTLTDSLGGLTSALSGVTDAASAQAALAKVTSAGAGVATVSGLAAKFTPEQKAAVGTMVSGALPGLKDVVAKVEGMAGVGDVIKPAIDPIVAQLDALTK